MPENTNRSAGPGSARAVWIALAVAAALAGFALGRIGAGPPTGDPTIEGAARVEAGSRAVERGALIAALRIPDPFERVAWLATKLPLFGPEIVPEIRYALQSYAIDKGPAELDLLARRWAREDPALAFDWALTRPPLAYREGLVRAVAREWAVQDPQGALEEISTLPPGSVTQGAIESLISGWLESGEPGLETFVYDLGYSVQRQLAVSSHMRALGLRNGPQAIVDFAESVSTEDDRYKRTVMRKAASEMTTLDPSYGAAWEEKHGQGPYGHTILGLVASRWVLKDGPAAMEWLSKAEPGNRRDTALRDAFRLWRQRDRAEMFAWVEEMGMDGVEPWFEPAIGLYVMALSVVDPAKSMDWAELMPDEVKRRSAKITVARRWRRADAEAAEAWILASDLTDSEREVAREPLPVKKSPRPYFEKLPPPSDETDVPDDSPEAVSEVEPVLEGVEG